MYITNILIFLYKKRYFLILLVYNSRFLCKFAKEKTNGH